MANRGRSIKQLVSFNAGELSPLLDARVDVEKYGKGCRVLQNAIIETYGAVRRRPGLRFVAQAKHANRKCRLLEFLFSTSTSFIIEAGHEYMRFFKDRAQVLSSGTPYEIATPYQESELFELQYRQINDVVYITHPNHAVRKLSRVADTTWTLDEVAWSHPPLLDENLTAVTVDPSATSGTITLTASSALFDASHVGAYWEVSYLRTDIAVRKGMGTGGGSSPEIRIAGTWRLRTSGTWDAIVAVERSYSGSGGPWELVRQVESASDSNYDTTGIEPLDALYRVTVSDWSSGSGSPRAILEVESPYGRGYVKITGFTSSTVVTATVLTTGGLYGLTPTRYWAEGAWSPKRGHPAVVALFEQRLCFSGTSYRPGTVWGSATDDYENFLRGTTDTDAFVYTIPTQDVVRWMVAQKALLIGTAGGEWSMQGSNDSTLTASNVVVRLHSNYGSANLAGRLVNDVVLFTQRQGRKVREMAYTYEKEGYVAPDLTLLAEHVTAGGIVQTAYQKTPNSILWAVTGNGELIGMTYERDQEVVGWHRHNTLDRVHLFESVGCIYGAGNDEVWAVVKRQRNVDGVMTNFRYIELMNPVEWVDQEDAFYVDSGVTYDGAPVSSISNLGHLEGAVVTILADGAVQSQRQVVGGAVTLDRAASVVQVGLAYGTMVEPMRLDTDAAAGVSMAQVKRIHSMTLRLSKSLGLEYSDGVAFNGVPFRVTGDLMDAAPPLFTGDKEIEFQGDFDEDARIVLSQYEPLPFCLLAIVVKYAITGA
jgi:hypothetical protein